MGTDYVYAHGDRDVLAHRTLACRNNVIYGLCIGL